ncbi:hypothetical protein ACIBK8_25725 [Streptomyces sp. NPDC050161]|uniref:hypothetical protein n=1 Tax=Streptomyces sp. NPDC050161 TaxID=3365604 RepID=UPI0037BCA390
MLTRADHLRLYVMHHSLHRRQILVSALEPDHLGFDAGKLTEPPKGIAVPRDPVRAAATVERRLMPAINDALATVHAAVDTALASPDAAEKVDVSLLWQPDGPPTAITNHPLGAVVLQRHWFHYRPHSGDFRLPDGTAHDAAVQCAVRAAAHLGRLGASVTVAHASTPPQPAGLTVARPLDATPSPAPKSR